MAHGRKVGEWEEWRKHLEGLKLPQLTCLVLNRQPLTSNLDESVDIVKLHLGHFTPYCTALLGAAKRLQSE